MSTWTTLGDLPPGALFETQDGVRAMKTAHTDAFGDPRCYTLVDGEDDFPEFPTGQAGACMVRPLEYLALAHDDPAQREMVEEAKGEVRQSIRTTLASLEKCTSTAVVNMDGASMDASSVNIPPGSTIDTLTVGDPEPARTEARVALRMLHALLGLSDAERSFLDDAATAAVAQDLPATYDVLLVFADWLEEQGRDVQGAALRRLVPESGELLVLTFPGQLSSMQAAEMAREAAGAAITHINQELAKRGRDVAAIALPSTWTLDRLSDDNLNGMGLMRIRQWEQGFNELRRAVDECGGVLKTPDGMGTIGLLLTNLAARLIRLLRAENTALTVSLAAADSVRQAAVADEREACAGLADEAGDAARDEVARLGTVAGEVAAIIARYIRKRGEA